MRKSLAILIMFILLSVQIYGMTFTTHTDDFYLIAKILAKTSILSEFIEVTVLMFLIFKKDGN